MPKQSRVELVAQLQKERDNTIVISYVTGTRNGLEFPIEIDAIRKFYEHLILANANKRETKVDLILHSNGGNGIVPWRLVTLLREHCKHFTVLIPHRAFSAATLIALGADEIVMHPMGMLGPVDPTVTNPFNPKADGNPNQILGISVEDVSAYIALIKEDVGINHEDELVQAFNLLASKVHPLALGNVKRFMAQSRLMAKKLLGLHMDKSNDEHKINEIVENLTSKLYFHGHPINRKEAGEDLGLKISKSNAAIEEIMWKLYLEYEAEMLLDTPFRFVDDFVAKYPALTPGQIQTHRLPTYKGVYIESAKRTDVFTVDFEIIGQKMPNGTYGAQLSTIRQGWVVET